MRRLTYLVFGLAGLFLIIFSHSCTTSKEKQYYKYQGEIQGTYFYVVYEAEDDLAKDVDSLLSTFNKSLNNYDSTSTISLINSNKSSETDSLFRYMYKVAKDVWNKSGGLFDISIAPLVNRWGFGYENENLPDSSETDSILQFTGLDKVELKDNKILKTDERIQLIGNAIAQGMSVDYLALYFESKGIKNYLVDIGGEIRAKGESNKGKAWVIGIDKPIVDSLASEREVQEKISIENNSVATSGNYRKYKEVNGKRYGHSINPKTGWPQKAEILSATVLYPECIYADAWATAFMLMDLSKAIKHVEKSEKMEAMFIIGGDNDSYEIITSKGFPLIKD